MKSREPGGDMPRDADGRRGTTRAEGSASPHAADVGAGPRIFEVFVRAEGESRCRHMGDVAAATAEAALVFAHEQFGRRGAWGEIWVAPRDQIAVMTAADTPGPAFPRAYRAMEGYRDVVRRWQEAHLQVARRREGQRA